MTFELKPVGEQDGFSNIMQFYGGHGTNPICGTFIPEIHKKPDSATRISFKTCVNDVYTDGVNTYQHSGNLLEQLDWNQIEVGQRNIEGQYQYYIKISGTEAFTKDNNQPISFTNVHAFIGTSFLNNHLGASFNWRSYSDCELRNIQGKVCPRATLAVLDSRGPEFKKTL